MKEEETYHINIEEITKSHETVLNACDNVIQYYLKKPKIKIILDFSSCNFIYPDYSLLLLCAFKFLESQKIKVFGTIVYEEPNVIKYLSRMNFFKYLNVEIPEKIQRLPTNKFVEIQRYDEHNQLDVLKSIMTVIKSNSCINDNAFAGLDYCLNEILDNVLNHSGINEGWVVAQYFEKINSIRLIVCDIGLGIHKSLNEAHNYSEEDAIINCIVDGVTNGKGQGHGLFATSSFAKLNKGWLSLVSGNKKFDVSEQKSIINNIPFWQGTCVYLRVNTNIDVDYKLFTSKHYDYKAELFDDMFK